MVWNKKQKKGNGIYWIGIAIALVILVYSIQTPEFQSAIQSITNKETPGLPEPALRNMSAIVLPKNIHLDQNVTVHFIDVGQGDSILVQLGSDNILVDAGATGNGKRIWEYLQENDINHVTYLIATHEDEDHIGSMDEVIEQGLTFDYYSSTFQACTTKACRDVAVLVQGKKLELKRGDQLNTQVPIFVFNPVRPLEFDERNNNSIVLFIMAGNTRFLLTGDCEKECEESMLQGQMPLDADVLKAGHHGSRTSTSTEFVQQVSPEIAIISVGANNSYGHPHESILERLQAHSVRIYRTDQQGTIRITTDGNTFSVKFPEQN